MRGQMPSHERYTEVQKQFFAKLLLQHKSNKEAVIQGYRVKFQDHNFGNSQYRYLRGEVGRHPSYGAPLLQSEDDSAVSPEQPVNAATEATTSAQMDSTDGPPVSGAGVAWDHGALDIGNHYKVQSEAQSQDPNSGYLQLHTDSGAVSFSSMAQFMPVVSQAFEPAAGPGQHQQQQQPTGLPRPQICVGHDCQIPVCFHHIHHPGGFVVFRTVKAVLDLIARVQMEASPAFLGTRIIGGAAGYGYNAACASQFETRPMPGPAMSLDRGLPHAQQAATTAITATVSGFSTSGGFDDTQRTQTQYQGMLSGGGGNEFSDPLVATAAAYRYPDPEESAPMPSHSMVNSDLARREQDEAEDAEAELWLRRQ